MEEYFDVVVIGSGPAGSTVATLCMEAGKKVAVVDRLFGGTCALRGCTPKKAMETVSTLALEARELRGRGFPVMQNGLLWDELLRHKQQFTEMVPANTRRRFKQAGIAVFETEAYFIDDRTLYAGNYNLTAEFIIIATGARPQPLQIPGEEFLLSSADFMELAQLPQHLVFAGGGYISFELAPMALAAGSEVVILVREEQPLQTFDPALVNIFLQSIEELGADVRTGCTVTGVQKTGETIQVEFNTAETGRSGKFETGAVVHGAGRIPELEALNLKAAGIGLTEAGAIEVNEFLQCPGNERVYAIGDVNGLWPFTPVAEYEAELVAANILQENQRKVNYMGTPTVLFSFTKLAKVGKLESELKEAGINYELRTADTSSWLIERALNIHHAGARLLVDPHTDQLLGAHLLGPKADETINLFALMMQWNIPLSRLSELRLAFPTAGNALRQWISS